MNCFFSQESSSFRSVPIHSEFSTVLKDNNIWKPVKQKINKKLLHVIQYGGILLFVAAR
jgi:hypothetical protein